MRAEGSSESGLQQLNTFTGQLRQQVDPSAMTTFHTDHLSLTERLATVGHALQRQQSLLEVREEKIIQSKVELFLTNTFINQTTEH